MSSVTMILKPPFAPCPHSRHAFGFSNSSTCAAFVYLHPNLPRISLKLTCVESRYRRSSAVCLFGGKGKPENGVEDSPWKALEKAASNLKKERSIEDVLKDQIQKGEFYDDGGSRGGKGSEGGGGGGGGENSGNGEPPSEDESFSGMVDDFMQGVFAAIGFAFLYILILDGEEIIALARDSIKLLFTRKRSVRLRRFINDWIDFLEEMKEEDEDPQWLPRTLFLTRSNYDSPEKYQYILDNKPEMLAELLKDPETAYLEQSASQQGKEGGK